MSSSAKKGSIRWKIAQFAEKRWWKRYLHGKDVPSYLSWKRQYWHTFLEKINLNIPSNQRVLDAGCGPAGIFMALETQKVHAIDPLMDDYANMEHFSPDWYPFVQFEQKALEDFVTTKPYDLVFCLNAINHVDDIQSAMQHLAKATTPNGTLVLSIDAHRHNWLMPIFKAIPGDILHPHQYNLKEYYELVTTAGFTVENDVLYEPGNLFNYHVLVARKRI